MKSINSIKSNITRLNNRCNTKGISIFACLQELGISITQFCHLIGLDTTLLNALVEEELLVVLKSPDTRIFYNPGMTSLEHDEISIYSKELKVSIGFLRDKLKRIWDETVLDGNFSYYNSEFFGIRTLDGKLDTIHFACKSIIDNALANQKFLSQKFPLEHLNLKIKSTKEEADGKILTEDNLEVTINHAMLNSDLYNIFRILYHFNFPLASTILKLYPASLKIISDEATLNKFYNR